MIRSLACTAVFSLALALPVWAQQTPTATAATQTSVAGAPIDYETARLDRRLPGGACHGADRARRRARRGRVARRADGERLHPERSARRASRPRYDTEVRVLYDDDALYFGVFAQGRRAGANHRQRPEEGLQHRRAATASGSSSTRSTTSATATSSRPIPRARSGTRRWRTKGARTTRTGTASGTSQTRITETGWYAEIGIPFRTLKFETPRIADLGHQLRAQAAAAERRQLLVAAAAHLRPRARVAGRHARRPARAAPGQEHPRQAVRARQLAARVGDERAIDRRFRRAAST